MGISTQFRAMGEKSDTVEIASSKLSPSPDTIDVNKRNKSIKIQNFTNFRMKSKIT